jgi:hypothetical protein
MAVHLQGLVQFVGLTDRFIYRYKPMYLFKGLVLPLNLIYQLLRILGMNVSFDRDSFQIWPINRKPLTSVATAWLAKP